VTAVVDVGAHEGGYGRFLRAEVGWTGRIVSFEPQGAAFERLAAAAAANPAWEVQRLGLGARAGRETLSLQAGSTLASLHAMNAAGEEILQRSPPSEREEVRVSTLRREWRRLGVEDETVFLKTETQGFDLEVLRGAGPQLRKVVALQAEVAVLPLYEGRRRGGTSSRGSSGAALRPAGCTS
jgi:FkbM family methyltransferase